MGQKNLKGTVSISDADGRIRLRWRYQSKRYSLNLFSFSRENLLRAKKIAILIEGDLIDGSLDTTFLKYRLDQPESPQPQANMVQPLPTVSAEAVKETKPLVQWFEEWVRDYRNMNCETDIDYHSTRNMMKKWGSLDESSVVRHFNKESFGAKTYNRRLTLLQAFFKWTTKRQITLYNPLEDVLPKKAGKTSKANRKPFTDQEITKVLTAIREDTYCPKSSRFKHSFYYPFIYFLFKTGVRPAEAIGLRVVCIDQEKEQIHIKEVLARTLKGTHAAARKRKNTKNNKERILPLTPDLKEVLLPLLRGKVADDLVFQSISGLPIDDRMFERRVFSKVLQELGIEHRVLYACRHTFASRCIDSGMTPVQTAFLMGNNPETALRNYTHQLHVPSDLPKL